MTATLNSPALRSHLHRTRTTTTWVFAALCVLGSVTVSTIGVGAPLDAVPLGVLITLTVLTLLGSSVVSVRSLRGGTPAPGPVTASLGSALAAGILLAPSQWPQSSELGVLIGSAVAAVVALGLRLAAHGSAYQRMLAVMAGWFALFAVGVLTFVTVQWPIAAFAALIIAATPAILRMLPAASITIPNEQLLDHSTLMRLQWSVRSPIPAPPHRIRLVEVEQLVRAGHIQQTASTITWCLAALVSAAIVATQEPRPGIEQIATIILGVCLIVFLLLSPRKSSVPTDRWATRLTAVALIIPFGFGGYQQSVSLSGVVAIIGMVLVGLLIAAMAIPVASGVSSLGLSRVGDVMEGAAIVFIMPAGFVAGGFIELFRGLAS